MSGKSGKGWKRGLWGIAGVALLWGAATGWTQGVELFVNSDGSTINKPFSQVMNLFWRKWQEADSRRPQQPLEVVRDAQGTAAAQPDELSATWIGHATLLLRMEGTTILTDPHFSERASPVSWAGPKREIPLPYTLAELPHIDVVVISHNHYDHLDLPTLQALAQQAGGPPQVFVPNGLADWLREQGIPQVQALGWWQEAEAKPGFRVIGVPAHHWSARALHDRNHSHWSGWVLRSAHFSTYFSGDTGYSDDFKVIGERLGGVDLALVPVGAYEPRDFMREQHVNPSEALQIVQDVRARYGIGMHWGTFDLSLEPLDAPLREVPQALKEAGLGEEKLKLLKPGATWRLAE